MLRQSLRSFKSLDVDIDVHVSVHVDVDIHVHVDVDVSAANVTGRADVPEHNCRSDCRSIYIIDHRMNHFLFLSGLALLYILYFEV